MNLNELRFPKYNGLESQYEHNVYAYFDKVLGEKNYIVKVKKTDFANIDVNIQSREGHQNGKCDAYVLSDQNEDSLFSLVELESTGHLDLGIAQVLNYAKSLSIRYRAGKYLAKHIKLLLIVYDGVKIWAAEYNLETQEYKMIIEKKEVDDTIKNQVLDSFPENKEIKQTQTSHNKLIRKTKEIIRGNKDLQSYKIIILTILVTIYGIVNEKVFTRAIEKLGNLEEDDEVARGVLRRWNKLKAKLDYDDSFQVRQKVKQLYEDIAIELYEIYQFSKIDLYALIYEEFAEKHTKKEEGEYYTQRHIIAPTIKSIFMKYLLFTWNLNDTAEKNLEKIKKKIIADPFVGSGGFLYEFGRLLRKEYDLNGERKYKLNEIADEAFYGLDKNDPIAAFFNLFLVGAENSNIDEVETSINWQKAWKYKVQNHTAVKIGASIEKKKNPTQQELLNVQEEKKKSIESYRKTFIWFHKLTVDFDKCKREFSIDQLDFANVTDIEKFIERYEEIERRKLGRAARFDFFADLISEEYEAEERPVFKLLYNRLKELSSNKEACPQYEDFVNTLGMVDFLCTNVPYGNVDDPRFKTEFGGRLESVALKECIDLLKPSTYKVGYYNDRNQFVEYHQGEKVSNNDGGIASIIIPNGVFERDEKELRDYLIKHCNILAVIKLPFYSFSPYALVQTYFLVIQKKAPFEFGLYEQNQPVFMYISDNDGRANSDKRFYTKHLSEERVEIKNKNEETVTNVYEFMHDDFEETLERYSSEEGYISKLERAWIFGDSEKVSKDWNQRRFTEKWDGKNWELKSGMKWKFTNLEQVTHTKQIEKKNKVISDVIKELVEEDEEFIDLSIEEQKIIIEREVKKDFIDPIESIVKKDKDVEVKPSRIRNKRNLIDFVVSYYGDEDIEIVTEEEVKNFKEILYEAPVDLDTEYEEDLKGEKDVDDEERTTKFKLLNTETSTLEILHEIDDIVIDNEGNSILYLNIETQEYSLIPDYYLGAEQKITPDEIFDTLIRLSKLD